MRESCDCIRERFIPTGNTHDRHSICNTVKMFKVHAKLFCRTRRTEPVEVFEVQLHDCSLTWIQHFSFSAIIDEFSGWYSRQNETGMIDGCWLVWWWWRDVCVYRPHALFGFNLTQSCKIKIHVHRLRTFFVARKEAVSTQQKRCFDRFVFKLLKIHAIKFICMMLVLEFQDIYCMVIE